MQAVYFDESGNTGDWLLDAEQPFFAMAGVHFAPEHEAQAFECFEKVKLLELKFTKLRKAGGSQKAVRAFLEKDFVGPNSAGAFIVFQPHMVVTKYCDLVIGPSFEACGMDFYEQGKNLALANLLALIMPTMAGPDSWQQFLNAFIKCVRSRDPADFDAWQEFTGALIGEMMTRGGENYTWLAPVLQIKSSAAFFRTIAASEMNPALPSFTVLLDHWGKKLGGRFEAVCDESKALDEQRSLLETLSAAQNPRFTAGYDRRTMEFPLPMISLRFADSKVEKQVQLADVVAGSVACGLRAKHSGIARGFEFDMLQIVAEKGLVIGGMWPSKDITPESLGTI